MSNLFENFSTRLSSLLNNFSRDKFNLESDNPSFMKRLGNTTTKSMMMGATMTGVPMLISKLGNSNKEVGNKGTTVATATNTSTQVPNTATTSTTVADNPVENVANELIDIA